MMFIVKFLFQVLNKNINEEFVIGQYMIEVLGVYVQCLLMILFLVLFGIYLFFVIVIYILFDLGWMYILSDIL